MDHVLTLIRDPAAAFPEDALSRVRALLPSPGEPDWLAPETAVDLPFHAAPEEIHSLEREVVSALKGARVDSAIQRCQGRRKRLLVADMDSTVIQQEGIDELADALGLKARVADITERAMRGELDFEPALRERVALLKGLERGVIDAIAKSRITLTPGAATLVATMRRHGAYTALVSGGFTLVSASVAARAGFDEHRANILEFGPDDRLAGSVREPILGREAKLAALIELRGTLGLGPGDTMAVGDGANDLAMIAEAGLGVAFRAKPAVAAAARARIDHGDLTALLYLQGYRRTEFVGPLA